MTVSAGKTFIGKPAPLVRLIPNTPSWIGERMNPYCFGSHVGPSEAETARKLLNNPGRCQV